MVNPSGQCPFLVPVVADGLWMYPVAAYCRRPDAPVKVPARGTLERVCTTGEHARCRGFETSGPLPHRHAVRLTGGPPG